MTGAGCVPGGWTTADLPGGLGLPRACSGYGCSDSGRTGVGREGKGVGSRAAGLGAASPLARQVTPRPGRRPRRTPSWTL